MLPVRYFVHEHEHEKKGRGAHSGRLTLRVIYHYRHKKGRYKTTAKMLLTRGRCRADTPGVVDQVRFRNTKRESSANPN